MNITKMRPVSVTKKELASKLTEATMNSGRRPSKLMPGQSSHDITFDRMLKE